MPEDCLAASGLDLPPAFIALAAILLIAGAVLVLRDICRKDRSRRRGFTGAALLVGLLAVSIVALPTAQAQAAMDPDPCAPASESPAPPNTVAPTPLPAPTAPPTPSPTPSPTTTPPADIIDGAVTASVVDVDIDLVIIRSSLTTGPTATGPIPVGAVISYAAVPTIVGVGVGEITIASDPRLTCSPTEPQPSAAPATFTCVTNTPIAPGDSSADVDISLRDEAYSGFSVTTTIVELPGDADPGNNTATANFVVGVAAL